MAAKKTKPKDDDTAEIEKTGDDFHAELTAAFGPEPTGATATGAAPGGILRAVFRGLTDGGVKVSSLAQWVAIVSMILELYETAKPTMEEIVQRIRERLGV